LITFKVKLGKTIVLPHVEAGQIVISK
jgi:hypothetical protein